MCVKVPKFCVLSCWDFHTFVVFSGAVPLEGLLHKYKEGESDHIVPFQQRQCFSSIYQRYSVVRDVCSLGKWLKWIL